MSDRSIAASTSASVAPTAVTRSPALKKAIAMAAPIPLLPPVTNTFRGLEGIVRFRSLRLGELGTEDHTRRDETETGSAAFLPVRTIAATLGWREAKRMNRGEPGAVRLKFKSVIVLGQLRNFEKGDCTGLATHVT